MHLSFYQTGGNSNWWKKTGCHGGLRQTKGPGTVRSKGKGQRGQEKPSPSEGGK